MLSIGSSAQRESLIFRWVSDLHHAVVDWTDLEMELN